MILHPGRSQSPQAPSAAPAWQSSPNVRVLPGPQGPGVRVLPGPQGPGVRVLPGPQGPGAGFGQDAVKQPPASGYQQPPPGMRYGPGSATPMPPQPQGTPYDYSRSAYAPPQQYAGPAYMGDGGVQLPQFDRPIYDPIIAQNELDAYRRQQNRIAAGTLLPSDPGYIDPEVQARKAAMEAANRTAGAIRDRERAEFEAAYRANFPDEPPAPPPVAVGRELVPTIAGNGMPPYLAGQTVYSGPFHQQGGVDAMLARLRNASSAGVPAASQHSRF